MKDLKFILTVSGQEGSSDCEVNMDFEPAVKENESYWEGTVADVVATVVSAVMQEIKGLKDGL